MEQQFRDASDRLQRGFNEASTKLQQSLREVGKQVEQQEAERAEQWNNSFAMLLQGQVTPIWAKLQGQ